MGVTTDIQEIEGCYEAMYQSMIRKDTAALGKLLADDFTLVHMTGMKQNKAEYLSAIEHGTLNYYAATHESMKAEIDGDVARLTGQSLVRAAVFGGGTHTWHLQLKMHLSKQNGSWLIGKTTASTY